MTTCLWFSFYAPKNDILVRCVTADLAEQLFVSKYCLKRPIKPNCKLVGRSGLVHQVNATDQSIRYVISYPLRSSSAAAYLGPSYF